MTTLARLCPRRVAPWAAPIAIAVLVVAVFWPCLGNDFVWDDRPNFLDNPAYRGLGWEQLRWMATTTLLGQWIPLTWLTLGADYALWGMNPRGYHLSSIVIHAVGAVLFYFVARRVLRAATTAWSEQALTVGAGTAALFFALHPLRAESVAWVTERRDVLSGVWFLLALLTYLMAPDSRARRRRWLGLSVACFVLAVLSKSIVVTLPALLVLLDIYPLRRLPWAPREWLRQDAFRQVWLEKVPYVVVSGIGIVMAFYAQQSNEYLTPLQRLSPTDRGVLVLHSLWFYASATVFPLRLMPLYELPATIDPLRAPFALGIVGVVIAAIGLLLLRRRWPAGLALAAAYVIMVSPVSGVFHNGHQIAADRYSYLPCLGWALLFGGGAGALLSAGAVGIVRPSVTRAVLAATVLALVGQAAVTLHQVRVWRDADTLWRYALDQDPNCVICHNNLGDELTRRSMPDAAIVEFQTALAIRPDALKARKNLGLALLNTQRAEEAADELRKALRMDPRDGDTWTNLGAALLQQGKPQEAVHVLTEGLQQAPRAAGVHVNLGVALLASGRPTDAVQHLERALELKPETAQARANLVRAYAELGQSDRAREQYEALRGLDPSLASRVQAPAARP